MTRQIPDILKRICERTRVDLEARKLRVPPAQLAEQARGNAGGGDFAGALRGSDRVAVIAEVKKASPSAGVIRPEFDPAAIASAYQTGGAAAISVLTDEPFFQGSLAALRAVRAAVRLPILRKDFILDPYQLHEARAFGADAVLLIVAALDDGTLSSLRGLAAGLGLAALVEAHDEEELERALDARAELIGVNNRNLHTFEVDLAVTERLARRVPRSAVLVSESGVKGAADVRRLAACGVDAILVGETLMRAHSIEAALRELADAPRGMR